MSPPRKLTSSKKSISSVHKQTRKNKTKKKEQEEEKEIPQPIVEEEEKVEERKTTWLDRLPKFVRGDEELHKKLSLERKEKRAQKHFNYCKNEVMSMIDVSFAKRKAERNFREENIFNEKILEKRIRRIDYDFIDGKYLPAEVDKEMKNLSSTRKSFDVNDLGKPDISSLLSFSDVNIYDSFIELMRQTFLDHEFTFDVNPKIDSIIKRLHKDMQPFTNPVPDPEPVDLPFIISITGPACSGKSTIAQFLKKHFKVRIVEVVANEEDENTSDSTVYKFVHNSDEKKVFSAISEAIENSKPGEGLVICNYPTTKQQFTALDKHLASLAKQKSTHLSNVAVIYRTTMTQEEAEESMTNRKIDPETGFIYSDDFNVPNAIIQSKNIPFIIKTSDFTNYQKILSTTSNLDAFTKKGVIVIQIGKLSNITQLEIQVENALRQAFDSHNVNLSFTSFVNSEKNKELAYAKQCNDIFNIWNSTYITQFGQGFSDMFTRETVVHSKIQFLATAAIDKYALILAQPDNRSEESVRLKGAPSYFDKMWNMTIKERDDRLEDIDTVIERSGLVDLKKIFEDLMNPVIESVFLRLCISNWFVEKFGSIPEGEIVDHLPSIIFPVFDPTDIQYNCKQIGVEGFFTDKISVVDQMYDFFNFQKENCQDEFIKTDSEICMRMFDFLLEKKDGISEMIDEALNNAKDTMRKWAQSRYCKEMEMFSQRFIDIKTISRDEPTFINIKDFADEKNNELIKRLGYRFSPNKPLKIEEKKIMEFADKMKKFRITSLDQFLKVAVECNFTDYEKDWLEALVRMSAISEFIDVHAFLVATAPSNEILTKIENTFNK